MSFNIHYAKTHLSRLLQRVESGEEIVLARAGKPVAKLVPIDRGRAERTPGRWRGRIQVADDFDAPLPADELAAWESGPIEPG